MASNRLRGGVLAASLVLACPAGALGGQPEDQLRPEIDRVLKVLEDPGLKGEAKSKERRDALHRIAGPIFAWTDMSQRSLGRHWQKRTDAEREEFVRLFRDLLERSYTAAIERYNGERIAFAGDSVQGDQATVRTKLLTRQGRDVSIDYQMSRKGNRWLIADVLVERVSLVLNFRAQFDQIIQASSYPQLLERMKSQDLSRRAS